MTTPVDDRLPLELHDLDLTTPAGMEEAGRRLTAASVNVGDEVSQLIQQRMAPWIRVLLDCGVDPAGLWHNFATQLRAMADELDPPGPAGAGVPSDR